MVAHVFALYGRPALAHNVIHHTLNHTPGLLARDVSGPRFILNALDFRADAFCFSFVAGERGLRAPFAVAVGEVAKPIWTCWSPVNGSHKICYNTILQRTRLSSLFTTAHFTQDCAKSPNGNRRVGSSPTTGTNSNGGRSKQLGGGESKTDTKRTPIFLLRHNSRNGT